MLEIKDLLVKLKNIRIEIPQLRIERGDYLAIIGMTGAGKTVFLETMAGFHKPAGGEINLEGRRIDILPPKERNLAIVYQDYMLFPHMNVRENIQYGLRIRGLKDDGEIEEIAKELEIDNLLDRFPQTLSGGEKQRCALARALIIKPQLLLLDEPFAALDPKTREKARVIVKRITEKYGITVIHVTHQMEDVFALANKVLVMKSGKVVQFGDVDEIISKPANEYVAHLFSSNVFKCIANDKKSYTLLKCGPVELITIDRAQGEVLVTIRPEDIIISREKISSSARNILQGKIVRVEQRGRLVWLTVDFGIVLKVLLTPNSLQMLRLEDGSEVYGIFKASALHVIGKI